MYRLANMKVTWVTWFANQRNSVHLYKGNQWNIWLYHHHQTQHTRYCTIFWPRHSTWAATFKHRVWSRFHCMGSSITAVQNQDFCGDGIDIGQWQWWQSLGAFCQKNCPGTGCNDPTLGDSIAPLNYFPCKEHQATHARHPWRKSSATNATKRHGSKFVHASLVQHPGQLGAPMSIASAREWADMNSMLYISFLYICIHLEPVCPLFWGLNHPKQGLFQSKQGSFRCEVYIYMVPYISWTPKRTK